MDIVRLEPRKAYWEGAVVAGAGVLLLLDAAHWPGVLLLLCLPGALCLIGAGSGLLLWPGDSRLPQYACFGSLLGLLVMPVVALSGEGLAALLLSLALVVAYLCAGRVSLHCYPRAAGAPPVPDDWRGAAHIGTDEMLLAWFKLIARPPREQQVLRIAEELDVWEEWLKRKRLRTAPQRWHATPPDLLKVDSREKSLFGQNYRAISFDSLYAPDAEMPGAQRWAGYARNQRVSAWVLEHPGPARPWLLTIHGYRMGVPWMDLRAFDPALLHHRWGLNLASIVLPLHGPRRKGKISGEGYLEGDFVDFVHAELQAQWDLRRLLSWLRLVKHAPKIGVYGLSLGGYNAALLSALDDDLACVVAGIPVVEMHAIQWRHFPAPELDLLRGHGIDEARLDRALSGVSPLALPPRLPAARLGIFAGTADTLVWPDQPLRLQQHWDGCALHWYEGAHLTFGPQHAVRQCLQETLQAGGLIDHG